MPLTDMKLRALKPGPKPQKLSDGGNLYLMLTPGGSKLWRMNYRFENKQKTLSFGAYPAVTLADARALRDRAKKALAAGFDPAQHKTTGDLEHDSFETVAREWLAAQMSTWAPKYAPQVMRSFERDVFPKIGHRPIGEIEPKEILDLLRTVEARGAMDIAKRLRQKISAIFRFATPAGFVKFDPAANLRDSMKKPRKVKHMAALTPAQMPEFFQKLRAFDGEPVTALALEFTIHTMTRTNEVRFARWSEIDETKNLWRIPGERMKKDRDHLIPLSRQARALLVKLKEIAGDSPWIAEGTRGKPMSENTMLFALYRMGYHSRATTHGFRSTASTFLNESGLWRPDAIERQLSHVPDNEVRAAYNAALYLDERTRMLQWWSDRLTEWEHGPVNTSLDDLFSDDDTLLV